MNYLSVCSGIEAASVAWGGLNWKPVGFSEIDPFPSEVLNQRYPEVKNFGDMTKYKEWEIDRDAVELLVGGTPCQSFSVAGLRAGLNDPRGNLMLTFGAIADYFKPTWIVWENVPGVLSSSGGRDFGTFLGMLVKLGYGVAYRVLDAQFFGVPQRRRRVFVVGYLGDWRKSASVLFESESLSGNTSACKKKEKEFARGFVQCFEPRNPDGIARLVKGGVAPTLNCMGGGQREPCVIMASTHTNAEICTNISPTLTAHNSKDAPVLSLAGNIIGRKPENGGNGKGYSQISYTLTKMDVHGVVTDNIVRKLTPIECERLQGFPDNWTRIQWKGKSEDECPYGLRYKAIGNSMAVPVMKWIGERIDKYDKKNYKLKTNEGRK